MTKRSHVAVAGLSAALLLASAAPAASQAAEGLKLRSQATELEINGRVQTQFNTTTVESEPESLWLLRRVRLEARMRINDLISGKVQPDFAGDRVSVKDAYLKLDFSPALQVLAGKAHRPFSLLEITSSARGLPIERGVSIRGVRGLDEYALVHDLGYSDRDIGLQLMGKPAGAPMGLTYAAGVFEGPSGDRLGRDNPQQFAARVTVAPAAQVRVGAGWSNRAFARRQSATAPVELERGNAWEVDLELGGFDPGFHFLGEVAVGDVNPFTDSDFVGAQGWLGYRTGAISRVIPIVEPILRLSYGSVDGGALDGRGGTLVTPGINLYFGGLNRLMLNYDAWSPSTGEREGSFKAQFQLVF